MPIYSEPVHQLMKTMAEELLSSDDSILTREEAIEWFGSNFPLVKQATITAHLIRLEVQLISGPVFG